MFDKWIQRKVDKALASRVEQIKEIENETLVLSRSLEILKKRISEIEETNARLERFCNENYKLANETHRRFDDMILDAMNDLRTYVDGVEAGIKLEVSRKRSD